MDDVLTDGELSAELAAGLVMRGRGGVGLIRAKVKMTAGAVGLFSPEWKETVAGGGVFFCPNLGECSWRVEVKRQAAPRVGATVSSIETTHDAGCSPLTRAIGQHA